MRVAIVTPAVHRRGGTEKCLAWLVEDLSRSCEVTLFTGEIADTDVSSARVHRLPTIPRPRLLRYLSFLASSTVALGLRRLMRKPAFEAVLATGGDCFTSDVVYAHFCCAAWSAMLARGRAVLPAATPRQRLRNLHYRLFLGVASRLEKTMYRRRGIRSVVAVSQGTRRELVRCYGVPPQRITVVPNAVDERVRLSREESAGYRKEVRSSHGIPEDALCLLFVAAGDWKRKGLGVVLKALAMLSDVDVRLLVVGREDIPFYQAEVRRLGVSERVVFPGFSAQVERYYAAADIFVYPSAYEAFSLVSLEAAGAGLPLLVTRINGTEDLVCEGANGFFIEPDPAGLAEKVRLLAADPALRSRMAAAAAESSQQYSRAAVAGRILDLLRSCSRAPEGTVPGRVPS